MDQVLHQVPGGGRPARIRSGERRHPGTAGRLKTHPRGNTTGAGAILRPWCFLEQRGKAPGTEVLNCAILRTDSQWTRRKTGVFRAVGSIAGLVLLWIKDGVLPAFRAQALSAWSISGYFRSEEHTSEFQSLRHLV